MTMTSTDRIEKEVTLRAPRSRVWRALTDHRQFSAWFQAELEGPFVAGQRTRGRVTVKGYEHLTLDMLVERIEPERYFSYRWHPGAPDPNTSYDDEPMTLVEFTLEEVAEGTRLQVVESGFDALPAGRRAEAFRMNEGGWKGQMGNIERYLRDHP
jgi:uncharacterized protein YndB with AHSA1/START domain